MLGTVAQPARAAEKLKVLTTFTVIADIAANVAGEAAEVVSITRPGADIHNYSPTPRRYPPGDGGPVWCCATG